MNGRVKILKTSSCKNSFGNKYSDFVGKYYDIFGTGAID